ncbi:uncharacterized protein FIBRA_04966 [Fibroporia radiculosa]|uniref:Chromatin assembly factor 1 subunit A dimerization domain-containing protein n=1 Tax=Fibroporia radiculosa TaxID=599839 RepID=J4H389_9APHY|nr:uncharacterized protein FIBRA_04966 [Fibroporia radiculosa]CCM02854.1 predicted protein [Fibroporia radiculosa]
MLNADIDIVEVEVEGDTPSDKPERTSMVELKNGRILLKQKLLSYEKMSDTMQEIVKFRCMLEERIEHGEPPLDAISEEYRPLIVKLTHESDKTIQALTKHIHSELLPVHDEDDQTSEAVSAALSVETVEKAIKAVANRIDYGLETIPGYSKVPAALHIWRWEVLDECRKWLPKAAREKAESRLAERRQAKMDAAALFASLSEEEKNIILGTKNASRTPLKAKTRIKATDEPNVIDLSGEELKSPQSKKQSKDTENALGEEPGTEAKTGSRVKKVDPEKAAKEKERQEKRAARVEKEKKEKEAQDKSRSIMANFFSKSKVPPFDTTPSKDSNVAGPSVQSDFERTFKPFVVKKNVKMAPINYFRCMDGRSLKGKERLEGNVIVLDDFDHDDSREIGVVSVNESSLADLGQLSSEERLQDVLKRMPFATGYKHRRKIPLSHLKTYPSYSVRDIMARLNEAEISGDVSRVRSLTALLRDRTKIPAKTLIFTEDLRPGYFGTWTRSSQEVGPRTPFARDVVSIDYTYDSGAEWEEENGEADDVMGDAEEEDVNEEQDSDLDSWLVDDDEVEEPGTPVEERACTPDVCAADAPIPLPTVPKRKAGSEATKHGKKRKVVVPLVPFVKGPCWESNIGQCSYEPFTSYRIQLLNDAPYPIDPFTFISAPIDEQTAQHMPDSQHPDVQFAVPALPSRLNAPPSTSTSAPSTTTPSQKRSLLIPKTTFPEAHIPLLLQRMASLATNNLTFIVESVHQDLREQRVKKNAIEAKVREIGEKCKMQKIWVVKPDVKAAYGLI